MRNFRRTKIIGGMALALAASASLAGVSWGSHPGAQTIDATFTPNTGLSKPTGGALNVKLSTARDPALNNDIPHANRVVVHLPSELQITNKKLPQCPKAAVENKLPSEAMAACGPNGTALSGKQAKLGANVGTGTAQVLAFGSITLPATVTAFNGVPGTTARGTVGAELLLHVRVEAGALSQSNVIEGQTVNSTKGAPYGLALDVPVPPLADGSAGIESIDLTIQKAYKVKKSAAGATASKKKKKAKKYNFVSVGPCTDGTLSYAVDTTFTDHPPASGESTQTCTS